MTELITRNRLALNGNTTLRDRFRAGIQWGTDAIPPNARPEWFGGPVRGPDRDLYAADFSPGQPDAANATYVLRYFASQFSAIRLINVTIYMQTSDVNGTTVPVYDQYQGIGHMAWGIEFAQGADMSTIANGMDMDMQQYNIALERLYNAYHETCRNAPMLLTNTVCHSSCHDNCHEARGRR